MNCFICNQAILDGEDVIATVRCKFHRKTDMVHALEVIEELTLEHENCPDNWN